ncbi:hypothetical protein HW132_34785 [Brasilonema sp. CT11]|nr:hypothetical protein [Brasilonema sp. CT11]
MLNEVSNYLFVKKFSLVAAIAFCVISVSSTKAIADSHYQNNDFRIKIGYGEGWTYEGCDRQNHCINLNGGNRWHEYGEKGTFWENGEYSYAVFSRDSKPEVKFLRIRKNGNTIMQREIKYVGEY